MTSKATAIFNWRATAAGGAPRTIPWEAIAAGVLVAILVEVTAALAGFGLFDDLLATGSGPNAAPLLSPAGLFWVVAAPAAFAAGGFASARLADAAGAREAALCGLLTFSTALLVTVLVQAERPPALVGRSLGPVGAAVSSLATAARLEAPRHAGGSPALPREVQAFLDRANAGRSQQASEAETAAAYATILAGIAETADAGAVGAAVTAIETASGMARSAAERRLLDWQRQNDRDLRIARRAADRAAGELAAGCFTAFLALLAALLAAVAGGLVGRPRERALEMLAS
ncbi:hypothetical protein [Jiella sonneratiae]|uniref:Type II secretion system protein GspF domain-containing protein n=1 Tax=Jiella sonneratiae TaxID=2816856 RepID=A0ABS3J487_9HYPH|nr:hypothetical protein [Jiella sonneratiae]MBO0904485.1 hypothetical protein [Jiella sonneratiae]